MALLQFRSALSEENLVAIEGFVKRGQGLYIIADNEPYFVEANQLAERLFRARLAGNYMGTQTIAVSGKGITRDDYQKEKGNGQKGSKTAGKSQTVPPGRGQPLEFKLPPNGAQLQSIDKSSHYVEDHALLTGIHYLYEGITISHIEPNAALQTVLTASDKQILAAVPRNTKLRVVVDCGFTRYYTQYTTTTAGTLRYAENVAAFLMGRGARKPVDKQSIAELLTSLEDVDAAWRTKAKAELASRSPRYAEVKDDLEAIYAKLSANDEAISTAAKDQLINAFQRAPLDPSLDWLGKQDPALTEIIWEQIDGRIERADEKLRTAYALTATTRLGSTGATVSSRAAAHSTCFSG